MEWDSGEYVEPSKRVIGYLERRNEDKALEEMNEGESEWETENICLLVRGRKLLRFQPQVEAITDTF